MCSKLQINFLKYICSPCYRTLGRICPELNLLYESTLLVLVWVCVRVQVYICVTICLRVCNRVYVCVHVFVCFCIQVYIYIYACVFVRLCNCEFARVCTICVCVCIYIFTRDCMFIYVDTSTSPTFDPSPFALSTTAIKQPHPTTLYLTITSHNTIHKE